MKRRPVVVAGVGIAAVVTVSTLLRAQPQAQHLPMVGDYRTGGYTLVLDGDDACIGTTTGIEIVRIANPARLEKLSSVDTLSDSRCVVAGRYAYVSSASDGLVVVDISNKTSPRVVGRHRGRARYSDVQVSGRYAYAVVSTGGLDVIDVGDPARLALAGAVSWAGTAGRVRLRGQTAYVSRGEGGVRVVDVSQAAAPAVVSELTFEGRGGLITVVNGHLAIATERGVCLYDLSSPRAPVLRTLLPGRLSDIYSDGERTLFVHSTPGVTTVLDLSNIDAPRVLGTIGEYFHDVVRRGDLVFGVLRGLKVYRLGAGPRSE
jgi:hypothetical protein